MRQPELARHQPPSPPSSPLPPPARTRVACVGDSLTRGSHQGNEPLQNAWNSGCGMRSSSCQGSYPAILQVLLDARLYKVRAFAESGRSIHSLMPAGCPPRPHALSEGEGRRSVAGCLAALQDTQLVADVVRFSPQILVVMLGTNDAYRAIVGDRLADVAHVVQEKLSLLVRTLRRASIGGQSLPLTLIMQPPTTMAELPFWKPTGACAAPAPAPLAFAVVRRPATSTCDCAAMHTW